MLLRESFTPWEVYIIGKEVWSQMFKNKSKMLYTLTKDNIINFDYEFDILHEF